MNFVPPRRKSRLLPYGCKVLCMKTAKRGNTPSSPLGITDRDALQLEMRNIRLSIEGAEPSTALSASIYPIVLEPTYVLGQVEWDIPSRMSSLMRVDLPARSWGQWLLLAWAAAGPEFFQVVPILMAGQWRHVQLVLPDLNGEENDVVTVEVDSTTWMASISITSAYPKELQLAVPQRFQELEVGTVIAEMAHRLIKEIGI